MIPVSLPRLAHRARRRRGEPARTTPHATLPFVAARLPSFVSRSFASSPLRNAAFRNFYFGSIGAALGYTMQATISAWLMATLTTSALMVALVQSASTTPTLLFGLHRRDARGHRRPPARHPDHPGAAFQREPAARHRGADRRRRTDVAAVPDVPRRRRIHVLPAGAAGEHQRNGSAQRACARRRARLGRVQRRACGGTRRGRRDRGGR